MKKFKFHVGQACEICCKLYFYVIKRTENYVTLEFISVSSGWVERFNGEVRRFKIRSREMYGVADVEFVEYKNFFSNGASQDIFATDIDKLSKAEAELKAILG